MNRYGRPRQKGKKGRQLIHASKLEDTIIKNLEDRGIEYEYEPTTFRYSRPGRGYSCDSCGHDHCSVIRRYTPDLRIKEFYVEIKGKLDSATRSKMEDFIKGDSGIDLRFIFMRDNYITKRHKSRYSDWAKKLKVKYHIGQEVPEAWIQEKSK